VENHGGEVRVRDAGAGRAGSSWQGTSDAAGVPEEKADEILSGLYASIADGIGGALACAK